MPLYSYTTPDGREFVEYFDIANRPETITTEDGTVAHYDFSATMLPSRSVESLKHGVWPMCCDASGVHSSQIEDMKKLGAAKGVDLKFRPDTGQAIYDSPSHRNACLNARDMVDKSRYG